MLGLENAARCLIKQEENQQRRTKLRSLRHLQQSAAEQSYLSGQLAGGLKPLHNAISKTADMLAATAVLIMTRQGFAIGFRKRTLNCASTSWMVVRGRSLVDFISHVDGS